MASGRAGGDQDFVFRREVETVVVLFGAGDGRTQFADPVHGRILIVPGPIARIDGAFSGIRPSGRGIPARGDRTGRDGRGADISEKIVLVSLETGVQIAHSTPSIRTLYCCDLPIVRGGFSRWLGLCSMRLSLRRDFRRVRRLRMASYHRHQKKRSIGRVTGNEIQHRSDCLRALSRW